MTIIRYPNNPSPFLRAGVYSTTASELAWEIAAEKAAAEARIAAWRASVTAPKGK